MAINQDLIRALYGKYAPEKDVDIQIALINNNYDSQDKFVEEFYEKYGEELTLERKLFINANYGGFENIVQPTVNVDDFDLSLNEKSAEFISLGNLTDKEYDEIDLKFKDISYFDETYLDEVEKVEGVSRTNYGGYNVALTDYILGGKISDASEELATKPVYTRDFPNLTEKDFEQDLQKEIDKILDPHKYNLQESEIEEINNLRTRMQSDGVFDLEKEAKKRLLNQYKNNFIYLKVQDKINQYILNNEDYFITEQERIERLVEEKGEEAALKEITTDQLLAGGDNIIKRMFIDKRDKVDTKKLLEEQSLIFTDINKFTEVSERILKEYNNNKLLGEEILKYKEESQSPGFEFDADIAVEMQKKLALYQANEKALLKVIPKIQTANKNLLTLNVAADLLGRNYVTLKANVSRVA